MGESQTINHFSHREHVLVFFNDMRDVKLKCNMCTGSLGLRYDRDGYVCGECLYFIHKKCAELPQRITHPLHALDHHLTLAKRSLSTCCYYCDKPYEDEFSYACDECSNFHMHMTCAMIPLPEVTSDQKIRHPFHSNHTLMLRVSKPRSCLACCKKDCVLIFSCLEDGCDFRLCPECIRLDTIVKCQSHDHLISLVENASCEIQCDACWKSYKDWVDVAPDHEVNRTRSLLFRCMELECDFNLHFLCGPLPSAIKYEYHMHPLVLLDHSVIEDDSDEYYCDACEEEVDPLFRVYCCADCKFVAHIHCLISEIMKAINEDPEHGELKALGENRWDQFGDHTEGNAEELTLKHIMDLITDPYEKKFLTNPWSMLTGDLKTTQRNAYNVYMQFNSRFRPEGSFEDIDIDKIQQLFKLDSELDLNSFNYETYSFTPEGGIKIDDKYLRQKVENVDGYMVPKTLATILRTFIHKKGDLDIIEDLSPQAKSVAATLLCIAIDKMCKTKVEDVTWDDLKYWNLYLRSFEFSMMRFRRNPLHPADETIPFNVVVRAFLGFEAMRCKENSVKMLFSRVADLEAELERCKGLLQKHKGFGRSSASHLMKEKCFKVASELKGKDVASIIFEI